MSTLATNGGLLTFRDRLMASGRLNVASLDRVEKLSAESGERLSTILTRLGLISEHDLAETFSKSLDLALVSIRDFPDEPIFENVLNRNFLKAARLIPIEDRPDRLLVAMADPLDKEAADAVSFAAGKPVQCCVAYARWLRLIITQSLQDMARASGKPRAPVLYLLDEFAALGHMSPIERAMGLMAGYGVQLWPILQDLHQLRSTYGGRAGTFFSNASVLQVFGVNDAETAQLVSGLLGQTTIIFSTESRRDGTFFTKGDTSTSDHHTGRPLMTPDEVRNMARHQELLFIAGQRPVLANKLRYYAEQDFAGLFNSN